MHWHENYEQEQQCDFPYVNRRLGTRVPAIGTVAIPASRLVYTREEYLDEQREWWKQTVRATLRYVPRLAKLSFQTTFCALMQFPVGARKRKDLVRVIPSISYILFCRVLTFRISGGQEAGMALAVP
jgi:hypothetical protein